MKCDSLLIFLAYGGKSLHNQSHGESFLSIFFKRFMGKGLYTLDEREAALSPVSQMSLFIRINHLVSFKFAVYNCNAFTAYLALEINSFMKLSIPKKLGAFPDHLLPLILSFQVY